MKKLFFIKRPDRTFTFLDSQSQDLFNTLKNNTWYSCELKEPRNPLFHAKMFALLQLTLDNLPEDSNLNRLNTHGLLKAIQFDIGETEPYQKLNGEIVLIPKSIAFENMDNIKFSEIYKKVIMICEQLTGMDMEDY